MAACGFRFDKEVARASGMNESTYANLWKGDRKGLPYADQAVEIARALKTTVEYLVKGEGPPSIVPIDPERMKICQLLRNTSEEKRRAALILLGEGAGSGRVQGDSEKQIAG